MTMLKINDNEITIPKALDEASADDLFCKNMLEGLRSNPKHLQSKYFYDAAGDSIFREIMNCEEYYPFNCELEIFSENTAALARAIMVPGGAFDLIELGAGDCTKSSYLLSHLVQTGADFTYMPIDISANIIDYLNLQLPVTIPGIRITGLNGEYFDMLEKAAEVSENRKVVLFLGSNLGNMEPANAEQFCRELRGHLKPGDLALIGIDLKKCPYTVLAAYNDKEGITRRFNLNLLERMNRELEADFEVAKFDHFPVYDPETGACKSYLISMADQVITLNTKEGKQAISFAKGEAVFMEISQKYTAQQVNQLGKQASFETAESFFDSRGWFMDTVWLAI
ncbi:L-histidine N(alpha)-methyltransferase [Mucilaginibacter angelicae]|uniref:L-histidine N(Alpha)-methyltransferase n=1 Tax=Mucilaginibacter angelicae TaxID=869718 RepID=A0ABV6LBD5_9SPHI